MEEVSTVIRNLADILEALETEDADYEITSLKPRTNDLLATDAVRVELSLCVPFLTTDVGTRQLALTPEGVRLDDDGSLQVDLMVAATDAPEGPSGSETDPTRGGAFDADADRSVGTATAENSKPDSADEDADATADGTTDSPAYQDPDRLRAVYEEYETFDEMTDALGVDVTSQTVRRHMIKNGIHEPASGTGSDAAETLLDVDPASTPIAADDRTHRESEQGGRSTVRRAENDRIVTDGDGATTAGDEASDSEDGATEPEATTVPAGTPSLPAQESGPRGDSTDTERDESDTVDEADSLDVDLPDHLTLEDVKTTVQEAQTLYEAQQRLSLDRDEARHLLQELNLLELVHGRAATRDILSRTVEDVNQRLRSATSSASEQS